VTTVGFIGLGDQGKPLASNALEGGFDVVVYDLRREPLDELAARGARAARSSRDVGARADVVAVTVVDDAEVEEVVLGEDGILAGARAGAVIAIHSTVRPATVRRIGERAAVRGVDVVDAPVSGGAAGAAARQMCYMVGGDREVLERCRPVFATSASTIVHTGPLGTGMASKLAHQVVLCVNMLAAHEGTELARRAGLDPAAFSDALHAGAAQSRIADRWARARPTAQMGVLFEKDLTLALELANELGITLPAAALTRRLVGRMLGSELRSSREARK